MAEAEPRILVGTLACGEHELERSLASLASQRYERVEQRILRDLPNREAHRRLYATFEECAADFDLFLKLDADMVFRGPDALARVAELFRERPDIDHAELAVHDWFSDGLILGQHVYRSGVTWPGASEDLFVDVHARYGGARLELWEDPAPLVDHSPDPAPYQAFVFGVHRALKARQPGRRGAEFHPGRSWSQFRLLARVYDHYVRSGDSRLALALLGAEAVLNGHIDTARLETKTQFERAFSAVADLDPNELGTRVARRWGHPRLREALHALYACRRGASRIARRLLPAWYAVPPSVRP
jgi:hypothetical protein